MNAEEIAKLCDALSITEKEMPAHTLNVTLTDRGKKRLAMCIVGKVLTSRLVKKEVFIDVMSKIWRVSGGVDIEPIKGNIFAFYFTNDEDRMRVLRGGPWSFDRAIIIFDEPTGTRDISNLRFNYVDFWVQIHNLPLLCMNEEIGITLGSLIGEVRDYDSGITSDASGRYIRVRVTIPVDKPLQRSLRVDLLGDEKISTMLLRYERLLDYCFKCGRLGHLLDECVEKVNVRDLSSDASRKLGVWLRAVSPPKRPFNGFGRLDKRIWSRNKAGGNSRIDSGNRNLQSNWRERHEN
ncbi:hypothetical protein EZV62_011844 [Acer yangbiense]|uniref:CCHC-type domain-containing protein n=1 Tax=Acer yangbiense TaxID=1000413 RepID=A0A5C7I6E5_9ROSI|nr:hypothetical protein EZV62_011844 [Acer yangbiense]